MSEDIGFHSKYLPQLLIDHEKWDSVKFFEAISKLPGFETAGVTQRAVKNEVLKLRKQLKEDGFLIDPTNGQQLESTKVEDLKDAMSTLSLTSGNQGLGIKIGDKVWVLDSTSRERLYWGTAEEMITGKAIENTTWRIRCPLLPKSDDSNVKKNFESITVPIENLELRYKIKEEVKQRPDILMPQGIKMGKKVFKISYQKQEFDENGELSLDRRSTCTRNRNERLP